MFRSYFSVALRQLETSKVYSLINVAGLAIGLASVVLISLFVRNELGYDSFWPNVDRIYRISRDYYATDGAPNRVPASNNGPVAPASGSPLRCTSGTALPIVAAGPTSEQPRDANALEPARASRIDAPADPPFHPPRLI